MTAILGFRRDGETWMASDTFVSLGDGFCDQDKLAHGKNFTVAFCDRARAAQIVEANLEGFKTPEKWGFKEAWNFSEWVRKLFHKYGVKKEADDSGDLPSSPLHMILGTDNGQLYTICGDGSVFREKKRLAYGTGGDYALGVMFALWNDAKVTNHELATRAILAGKTFSRSVGGRTLVKKIN